MRLIATGRQTEVVETGQPTRCGNRHALGPRHVIVGHLPCLCCWPEHGHRSFTCRECGDTTYLPPHDRNELPPPR